jgi:hypothetical protein
MLPTGIASAAFNIFFVGVRASQVAGILQGDVRLIGQALDSDVIIEPVRGPLIPGMMAVKEAAKAAGGASAGCRGLRGGEGRCRGKGTAEQEQAGQGQAGRQASRPSYQLPKCSKPASAGWYQGRSM